VSQILVMVLVGLSVGLLLGILAERTAFSPYDAVREVLAGEQRSSAAVVVVAMASALALTQAALIVGLFETAGSSYLPQRTSLVGILIGGVIFGVGSVFAKGCLTRCTVRAASGDVQAQITIAVAGAAAYATIHGVFGPLRSALSRILPGDVGSVDLAHRFSDLSHMPVDGVRTLIVCLAILAISFVVFFTRFRRVTIYAIGFGAIVAGAWIATATVFADPFEVPRPNAVSIAGPLASLVHCILDTLNCVPDYGMALVIGVLGGAFLSSLRNGQFDRSGFDGVRGIRDSVIGGTLMGFGAVVSGGCTIGQGLSGLSVLSIMAPVAILGIIIGIVMTFAWQGRTRAIVPAQA
jgi:uncharacterized membrane protein YedE/YeeE